MCGLQVEIFNLHNHKTCDLFAHPYMALPTCVTIMA